MSKAKKDELTVGAYLDLEDEEVDKLAEKDFLHAQRALLVSERAHFVTQASELKAEAESLVSAGDILEVQFDEESGEGATTTVDRERDLALAAAAVSAIMEVDEALEKLDRGSYGVCEICKEKIPRARLRALPYARLCVKCKEGGLTRRR